MASPTTLEEILQLATQVADMSREGDKLKRKHVEHKAEADKAKATADSIKAQGDELATQRRALLVQLRDKLEAELGGGNGGGRP